MNSKSLTAPQLEALREVSHVGMEQVARALSQLLAEEIDLRVPRVSKVDLAQVPELLGGADTPVVGITLGIVGDAGGDLLLILRPQSAHLLLQRLLGRRPSDTDLRLDELGTSALQEFANILASVYLGALGDRLRISLLPTPPRLACDMLGAIADEVLITLSLEGDTVLMVDTEFFGASLAAESIVGHLLLLPAPSLLALLGRKPEGA